MYIRYNSGSHYENHQCAAELHDVAAHQHRVAEQRGKQDHLAGRDYSHEALERSEGHPTLLRSQRAARHRYIRYHSKTRP